MKIGKPSENHRLFLVGYPELLFIWPWADDSNPYGCDDDYWPGDSIAQPLCLQIA
jgi:hypothetical protein